MSVTPVSSPERPSPIPRTAVWWIGGLVAAGAIGLGGTIAVDRVVRGELTRSALEWRDGKVAQARDRIARLCWLGLGGPQAAYALGAYEAELGHTEAAIAAWASIRRGQVSWSRAQVALGWLLARERGRFRQAEGRFWDAVELGGPEAVRARWALAELLTWEGRLDATRGLLEDIWRTGSNQDRKTALRESLRMDELVIAREELAGALAKADQYAPDDDRAMLAHAWIDRMEGRFDSAGRWLMKCRQANPRDRTVSLEQLELAIAAGDPRGAITAYQSLVPAGLPPVRAARFAAWLARMRKNEAQERQALGIVIKLDPGDGSALDRLAAITSGSESARFRAERSRVLADRRRYRELLIGNRDLIPHAEISELARLSSRLGRRFEAYGWLTLELERDPGNAALRAALARLEREQKARADSEPMANSLLARAMAPWASSRIEPSGSSHAAPVAVFRDDARASGLVFTYQSGRTETNAIPATVGGGVAVLDYNGDGWLDVYVVQGGSFPPSKPECSADRLFRNRGYGVFEDATVEAGIDRLAGGYGLAVTAADYDGDGKADLFVSRFDRYQLLRNQGGRFEDVTAAAGLTGVRDCPTSAAFGDFDADGDLDLFVCHYLQWDPAHPKICPDPDTPGRYMSCNPLLVPASADHLFRNDNGRFVDVSESAGVADREGRGLGVVAADLDLDGRLDLFVANDMTANFFYRNLGGMRFEEIGHASGVACNAQGSYQAGMGVACGDYDRDGLPDLAVTNFFGESTSFFKNLGAGLFTDATAAIGLRNPTRLLLGFGVAWLDADNDGRLDLISANGHIHDIRPRAPYEMPLQLLMQNESGRLEDWSEEAGAVFQVPRLGRGLAVADLDNDGRLDGLAVALDSSLVYLHNQTAGKQRHLTVMLVGKGHNRDAIGARVKVAVNSRCFTAWRTGGGSYASSSTPWLHFGLGAIAGPARVEVVWPSGQTERHDRIPLDSLVRIEEGNTHAVSHAQIPLPERRD